MSAVLELPRKIFLSSPLFSRSSSPDSLQGETAAFVCSSLCALTPTVFHTMSSSRTLAVVGPEDPVEQSLLNQFSSPSVAYSNPEQPAAFIGGWLVDRNESIKVSRPESPVRFQDTKCHSFRFCRPTKQKLRGKFLRAGRVGGTIAFVLAAFVLPTEPPGLLRWPRPRRVRRGLAEPCQQRRLPRRLLIAYGKHRG